MRLMNTATRSTICYIRTVDVQYPLHRGTSPRTPTLPTTQPLAMGMLLLMDGCAGATLCVSWSGVAALQRLDWSREENDLQGKAGKMEEGREKVVVRREVNEWKILHGEENEREEQLNEGGHRDWIAFLMGSMQTGSITEGSWGRYNPYGLMSNYFTIKRENGETISKWKWN